MINCSNDLKIGQTIYYVLDEPFTRPRTGTGTVTEINIDHFIYHDNLIDTTSWGFYDTKKGDSIVYFKTENEAENYIKERK